MKTNETISFIEIILAGVGFGFLGIFGRLAFAAGISVGELLTFRFFIASLILWIGLLVFKPELVKVNLGQIIISSLLGFFGYAVFSTLYFKSIEGVSVAIAAMLLFTFPIFVNIGSVIFLKEKMRNQQWLSLFLAILGVVVLLWGRVAVEKTSSIIFGLLAGITYAIYVLISGQYQKNVNPLSSSLYVMTAASLALGLYHRPSFLRLFQFQFIEYFYIFGISVICTILPLTLFLSGMQKITSSRASIIVMIEPVTAALAAWLFLSEKLTLLQCLGAFLVFCSLALNKRW